MESKEMMLQLGLMIIGQEVGQWDSLYLTEGAILKLLGSLELGLKSKVSLLKYGTLIRLSPVLIHLFAGGHGGISFQKIIGILTYKIYMLIKIPSLKKDFNVFRV